MSAGPGEERDARMMARALELAEEAAARGEVPVGAVIVDGNGAVIGEGKNFREEKQAAIGHAEIAAIQAASVALGSWRLIGCTLYVTLEPCPMCLGALQQARVSRVVYAAKDPKGGAISLGYHLHQDERTNHRFAVELHEKPASSSLLKRFFSRAAELGSSPARSSR